MSFDTQGFDQAVTGTTITLNIADQHPLIKLAQTLPWPDLLDLILPDLKQTEKRCWWRGRPLRIRIHLGIYLLQQMLNLTDRQTEYALRDNAAFRLFCGVGFLSQWHAPDHTKIEAFRSRLLPETQRKLANLMATHAVKLNYACPTQLDVDSTVQAANISHPSSANLLVKTALLAKRIANALTEFKAHTGAQYHVHLKQIKIIALHYFTIKRRRVKATPEICLHMMQSLWREVAAQVMPILKDSHLLLQVASLNKHGLLRRALEQLHWRGYQLLHQLHEQLFEDKQPETRIYALHAYDVVPFNKGKLSKKVEYGRAFQLGRIRGNFLFVGKCTTLRMSDAASLPAMISEHETLFGEDQIHSVAVDKGYYSHENKKMLAKQSIEDGYLPAPRRTLNTKPSNLPPDKREALHNRRAGIEPLIGHAKHGGQLGQSRMKSDASTLGAGYAAILGFNLRQLKRYLTGVVRPLASNLVILEQKTL